MRTNKGKGLILLGLLLIAAALFLTGYNLCDNLRAERAASQVIRKMDFLRPAETEGPPGEQEATPAHEPPAPGPATSGPAVHELAIPDYLLNPNMEMPAQTIDGIDYIGVLRIPAIDLELPVISDWSDANLKLAPCRYSGSAYLGDLILCAHNYTAHFGNLRQLQQGDTVAFTDMDGNEFVYTVAFLETLGPADLEGMEGGDWDLTLFTCTIGGQTRVAVRCEQEANGQGS